MHKATRTESANCHKAGSSLEFGLSAKLLLDGQQSYRNSECKKRSASRKATEGLINAFGVTTNLFVPPLGSPLRPSSRLGERSIIVLVCIRSVLYE
jgi:hypothetical protein